ncbi:YDG/SRA domain-containing protein [Spirosoma sp. KUDC1026]|uniref:YDG/SRA domain-containing protein n=1 Tax=Spirosoma sp. KUDC1026 TaxID=2745947 RepID=UPI00159BD40E|nr:YDG/SRA domain-containing protein [Spirosoma sp. KUDC1026]QKZ15288.1 HNH endonuclease [Spirosoma sp. KUDC1026]
MPTRIFGDIPGIPEGSEFDNRIMLSQYGVHRPRQAGISGSQTEGADSIVLSGGYEDDEDLGDEIIYTGHGGRSIETGLQVADQQLARQNLALAINCQRGLPVRVIRGYHHRSPHSPIEGYRYDGLYRVDSYWRERGRSGFFVWRFRLVKLVTVNATNQVNEEQSAYGMTKRVETTVQRIVRNTELAILVKEIYDYQCQVCRTQVMTSAGLYAEAAHIQPLGRPHNGPDTLTNLLCLCPNHHVMFDFGGFGIADDLNLIGLDGQLFQRSNHKVSAQYLQYHREHFLLSN